MDRRTLLAAAGAAAVLPHGIVRAQAFPSRPISIYVAFPAGGPTDQLFRAFAESASKILGQSVIVENKPSGGGTLAPIAMKNQKPHGYVVSQMPPGVFRVPHMQKSPQFDPIKDFNVRPIVLPPPFNLGSESSYIPVQGSAELRHVSGL